VRCYVRQRTGKEASVRKPSGKDLPKTTRDRWSKVDKTIDLAEREVCEDDVRDAGRYIVICEAHATCVQVESRRAANSTSTLAFCDDCRDAAKA
jgi:hypothetical protein